MTRDCQQMLVNQALRVSTGDARLHAIQAFAGESQQEKPACGEFIDAPRLQIEKRVLFDLANRSAVGTLHVIGINFKLRFGIDLRIVREQEIAVRLLGVSLLRIFVDHDATVENAVRMPIQNSVVKLPAAAVWFHMFNVHVVIEMLPALAYEQTIDQALSAFACQHGMNIVADQTTT